nr:uncharacterized protein LOC113687239 [Coffea arabica]
MINIFAALNYMEDMQVNFVVFQYEGLTRTWWNVVRAKWEREGTAWTWLNFVREFNDKYFSPIVQEKSEHDFIKLHQGTLSVFEYETHFTKLSKFAPELIAMEQRRVRRFVQGLNVKIQEALAAAQINTFTEVLVKAQRIKIASSKVRDFHAKRRSMPAGGQGQLHDDLGMPPSKVSRGAGGVRISGTPKEVTSRGTSQVDQTLTLHLSCGYCGKTNHTENNCWRKARKCLWCGSVEHQLAVYPRRSNLNFNPANIGGNKPRVPAKVYLKLSISA